jgi:uncharacterized protein YndB with AHSA1/START domain
MGIAVGGEGHEMSHPFETRHEVEVAATPDQVWDALTSGPKIDSWFMGRNTVEPRVGGSASIEHAAFTMTSTVTAWEPPTHLAFESPKADDGAFHVFDYTVEPRDRGSEIRWVHSGALGPDWEAEYEGMSEGDPLYFHKLATYLTYFFPRAATPIDAFGPRLEGREPSWEVFREPLKLAGPADADDAVQLRPDGLDPIDGIVDWRSKSFLAVRNDDALYVFIHAFDGSAMVGHHLFAPDVDRPATESAWQDWLTREFS